MSLAKKIYIVAALVFLGCNVLFFTPGKDLPEVGDWFGEFNMDKLIHSGIFALMSGLFMLAGFVKITNQGSLKKQILVIAILFVVWGICTEFIQKAWIPGRNFSGADMLADGLGVLLAWGLARWFTARRPVV